jgi:hypothetical protein
MVSKVADCEYLEPAKRLIAEARSTRDLRQAQAVVLPLEFGDPAPTGAGSGRIERLGLPIAAAFHPLGRGARERAAEATRSTAQLITGCDSRPTRCNV